MIVVGPIVSDIPTFTVNWLSIFIAWNTKWIRNSLQTSLKSKLCLIDMILYFYTLISLSASGTLSSLTLSNPVISCINAWSGANLPTTCRVVILKNTFQIIHVYLLKIFKYCNGFSVEYISHRVESNIATQKNKMTFHLQIICLLS